MAILGSLFAKKKAQETKSSESLPLNSDEIISAKEIDTPFGKATLVTKRYSENPPVDISDEPEVAQLATVAVWRYNTHQSSDFIVRAVVDLYDYAREHGGRVLLELDSSLCMKVGMAFTLFALFIEDDNRLVNSVAAENAIYCLGKGFFHNGDKRSACLLFSLLTGPKDLLMDQFVTATIDEYQSKRYPLGLVFMGRNPYRDPGLQEFRDEAVAYRLVVARYLLDSFYDCETESVKGAHDFFYLLPTGDAVGRFMRDYADFAEKNGISDYKAHGEKLLRILFGQVEKTLQEY